MHVILDSVFLQGRVNLRTPEMEFILDRAQELRWNIHIPEAVLFEIIQGMSEEIRVAANRVKNSILDAQKKGINIQSSEIDIPTSIEKYKVNLQTFIRESGIEKIPFPNEAPTLKELFELAAQKMPPFNKQGDSFRDAIIWLSVAAFAKQHSEQIIFATKDQPFIETCQALSQSAGNIKMFNYEDLTAEFNKNINEAKRVRIENLRKKIKAYLETQGFENLRSLINTFPFQILPSSGSLIGIDGFITDEMAIGSISEKESHLSCSLTVRGKLYYRVQLTIVDIMTAEWMRNKIMKPRTIAEGKQNKALAPASPLPFATTALTPISELPPPSPSSGSAGELIDLRMDEIVFSVEMTAELGTNDEIEKLNFEKIELKKSPYFISSI